MNDPCPVDLDGCQSRQSRILKQLELMNVDQAILTRPESVQWLTGAYVAPCFTTAAAISASGDVTLVVPAHVSEISWAATRIIPYIAQSLATIRDEQIFACRQMLLESLPLGNKRVAAEFSFLDRSTQQSCSAEFFNIEDVLLQLRRRKDPDELRSLVRANAANKVMYEHARQAIEPGIPELEIYNQLATVATKAL